MNAVFWILQTRIALYIKIKKKAGGGGQESNSEPLTNAACVVERAEGGSTAETHETVHRIPAVVVLWLDWRYGLHVGHADNAALYVDDTARLC